MSGPRSGREQRSSRTRQLPNCDGRHVPHLRAQQEVPQPDSFRHEHVAPITVSCIDTTMTTHPCIPEYVCPKYGYYGPVYGDEAGSSLSCQST